MKRRQFIEASAFAAGGLVLSFDALARPIGAPVPGRGGPELGDFLSITADGAVTFWPVKHEMGQGVSTALAQIVCEELCADWDKVRIEFPQADLKRHPGDRYGTGGSATVMTQYAVLRT